MAQLNFNAANVPQLEAQDVLPSGWYNAKIIESEMKPTNDQKGAYLALTFQILDGQFANRKLFTNVNLQNANPVAAEIGMKTLSAICHSTGVIQVADSQQLHGIPLQIKVALKPAGMGKDEKYHEASNDVKGYKRYEQGAPQQMGAPMPGGAAAPSWMQPAPQQQAPAPAPQQWQQPAPQFAPQMAPQQFQQPAPQQAAPQQQFQPPQQQAPMPWQVQAAPQQQVPVENPQWQQPAPQQFQHPAPQQMPQQGAPVQHVASHAGFQGQPAPAAQQVAPAASQPTPPWAS